MSNGEKAPRKEPDKRREPVFSSWLEGALMATRGLAGADRVRSDLGRIEIEISKLADRVRKRKIGLVGEFMQSLGLYIRLMTVREKLVSGEERDKLRERKEKYEIVVDWVEEREVDTGAKKDAVENALGSVVGENEALLKEEGKLDEGYEERIDLFVDDAQEQMENARQSVEEVVVDDEKLKRKKKSAKKSDKDGIENILRRMRPGSKACKEYDERSLEIEALDIEEGEKWILRAKLLNELKGKYPELDEDSEGAAGRSFGGREKPLKVVVADLQNWIENPDEAEKHFEQFFQQAYARPGSNFRETMTFEDHIKLADFFKTFTNDKAIRIVAESLEIGVSELQEIVRKRLNWFSKSYQVRTRLFDAFVGIEGGHVKPVDLAKMMASLTSEQFEFLFGSDEETGRMDKMGVGMVSRLYESAFLEYLDKDDKNVVRWKEVVVRPEGGELASSVVDEEVRDMLVATLKSRGEEWDEWKVNRALILGKSFSLANLRLQEIVAKERFPRFEEDDWWGKTMESPPYEDYVRVLNPLEHFSGKYWTGGPAGAMLYFTIKGGFGEFRNAEEFVKAWKSQEVSIDDDFFVHLNNLLGIGGFGSSGWRLNASVEDFLYKYSGKEQLLGVNVRLHLRVNKKDTQKAGVWNDALWMNPMLYMHEADYLKRQGFSSRTKSKGLWGKVYAAAGLSEKKSIERARRNLKLVQEHSLGRVNVSEEFEEGWFLDVEKREDFLDFNVIEDDGEKEQAMRLAKGIRTVAGSEKLTEFLLKADKDNVTGFRMTKGMTDVRWDLLDYSNMGHVGWQRRIRDFASASEAQHGLAKFFNGYGSYKTAEDMAHAFHELVYTPIEGFDGDKAAFVGEWFAEAMMRFHDVRTGKYLPWPIEPIYNYFKRNSVAEHVYGEGAMAWAAIDHKHFIETMRLNGNFAEKGKEVEERLLKRLKATKKHLAAELLIRYGPLGVVMFSWILIKEVYEQIQKDLEET